MIFNAATKQAAGSESSDSVSSRCTHSGCTACTTMFLLLITGDVTSPSTDVEFPRADAACNATVFLHTGTMSGTKQLP